MRAIRKGATAGEGAPLRWGAWPEAATPLTIAGEPGRWSFVAPFACGAWEAVLLVPWATRDAPDVRRVVAATEVRLPVGVAAPVAVPKSRRRSGPAA